MIGFKDLKSVIVRNSRTTDDKNKSSDINAKFNFVINVDRLEKALRILYLEFLILANSNSFQNTFIRKKKSILFLMEKHR